MPHRHAQAFLTKLLTVDLPGLIVLPKRLDINIPPAVTAVAEAAVGRDAVMRAVASAVLQVQSSDLPVGRDMVVGGVNQYFLLQTSRSTRPCVFEWN